MGTLKQKLKACGAALLHGDLYIFFEMALEILIWLELGKPFIWSARFTDVLNYFIPILVDLGSSSCFHKWISILLPVVLH